MPFHEIQQKESPSLLVRLWRLVRVERRLLVKTAILQALQSITFIPFTAGLAYVVSLLVNPPPELSPRDIEVRIALYGLANLALWPVHGWFTMRAFAAADLVMRSALANLRLATAHRLPTLPMSFFVDRGGGALVNQVTVDMARLEAFISGMVHNSVTAAVLGCATLIYLIYQNVVLALMSLAVVPLQYVIVSRLATLAEGLNQEVQKSEQDFATGMVEFVTASHF